MNGSGFDTERLSMLDEFGDRKFIIPAEVKGRYRQRRTIVHGVLIFVLLLLPWVEVGGHQAILLDVLHREFSFFSLKLYAHDAPFLFPIIAIAVFSLIFVTTVWGRIWCGWACPQTVFIDGVFRRIEVWVEGNFVERRRARNQPMTLRRFCQKIIKWGLFFVVASVITHSVIAFFIGAETLKGMMVHDPRDNMTYFILVSTITALILFDLGWFREQFCTIVCPYGRFQSLFLDTTSLAIVYDVPRGEPRRGLPPQEGRYGDCISCRRCVDVCPTGIDIRRGVQMECIACTACIDACDDVMEKMKKPKGLIRYSNLIGTKWTLKKSKAIFSLSMVLVFLAILIVGLRQRGVVDATLLRNSSSLFNSIEEEGVKKFVNQFHLHIRNQLSQSQKVTVKSSDLNIQVTLPENPFAMQPGQDLQIPLFVKFLPAALDADGSREVTITIQTELPEPAEKNLTTRILGKVSL